MPKKEKIHEKENLFPKVKKTIKSFVLEERGSISKHKMLALGAFLGSVSILNVLPEVAAAHTNYFSVGWNAGNITATHGHHASHASHASHSSHSSHGSHASHSSHGSHSSHSSHGSHASHSSHGSHSSHASHVSCGTYSCGGCSIACNINANYLY
ncbi:MAG: hypothetical protein QXM75_01835 [Candidatus Diapherotrites archaeon]